MILLLTITTKRRFPSHDYTGGFLGVDHPPTLTNWVGFKSSPKFMVSDPNPPPMTTPAPVPPAAPPGKIPCFLLFSWEKNAFEKKTTTCGTMWNQFVEFNWCWRVVQWLYLFHHEQFKRRFCSRNHFSVWWFTSPGNRKFSGIPSPSLMVSERKSRSMDCPSELNLKKRFEDVPSVLPEAIFDSV